MYFHLNAVRLAICNATQPLPREVREDAWAVVARICPTRRPMLWVTSYNACQNARPGNPARGGAAGGSPRPQGIWGGLGAARGQCRPSPAPCALCRQAPCQAVRTGKRGPLCGRPAGPTYGTPSRRLAAAVSRPPMAARQSRLRRSAGHPGGCPQERPRPRPRRGACPFPQAGAHGLDDDAQARHRPSSRSPRGRSNALAVRIDIQGVAVPLWVRPCAHTTRWAGTRSVPRRHGMSGRATSTADCPARVPATASTVVAAVQSCRGGKLRTRPCRGHLSVGGFQFLGRRPSPRLVQ
jgi:hypothetical protein